MRVILKMTPKLYISTLKFVHDFFLFHKALRHFDIFKMIFFPPVVVPLSEFHPWPLRKGCYVEPRISSFVDLLWFRIFVAQTLDLLFFKEFLENFFISYFLSDIIYNVFVYINTIFNTKELWKIILLYFIF